jgi:hypothetical protein
MGMGLLYSLVVSFLEVMLFFRGDPQLAASPPVCWTQRTLSVVLLPKPQNHKIHKIPKLCDLTLVSALHKNPPSVALYKKSSNLKPSHLCDLTAASPPLNPTPCNHLPWTTKPQTPIPLYSDSWLPVSKSPRSAMSYKNHKAPPLCDLTSGSLPFNPHPL